MGLEDPTTLQERTYRVLVAAALAQTKTKSLSS
jgi:hypothetical protein